MLNVRQLRMSRTILLSVLLVTISLYIGIQQVHAYYDYYFFSCGVLRPKNAKMTTVRFNWHSRSKNVSFYKLKYTMEGGKTKSIKLNAKRRSYTFKKLKKNKRYDFTIIEYGKNGKKLNEEHRYKYTGIAPAYIRPGFRSGDQISFGVGLNERAAWRDKYRWNYIDVYKREPGDEWKRIKTLSRKTYNSGINDESVEFGKTYEYGLIVRATAKIGGKRKLLKSRMNVYSLKAANSEGQFKYSFSSESPLSPEMKDMTVVCETDKYNDDIVIDFDAESSKVELYEVIDECDYEYGNIVDILRIAEYSIDDSEFVEARGKSVLKAGQKLTLRIVPADDSSVIRIKGASRLAFSVRYGERDDFRFVIDTRYSDGIISEYVFRPYEE